MKWFINALLIMFLVVGFSCSSNSGKKKDAKEKVEVPSGVETTTVSLKVDGMTCTGCENTIQSKLSAVKGVQSVEASHETGKVVVLMDELEFEGENAPQIELAKAVESSGYTVASIEVVKK